MTRHLSIVAIVTLIAVTPGLVAQEKPQPAPEKPAAAVQAPVQVQVVISRYRSDKKVASMPYLLSVPVNSGVGRLQVGGQVPVPSTGQGAMQYRNVGTSIDVTIRSGGDGRYEVSTNVSESAVAGEGQPALNVVPGIAPVLRTYTSNSTLLLRDGQTSQFNAATDPISGETVRVDVTLNVQK